MRNIVQYGLNFIIVLLILAPMAIGISVNKYIPYLVVIVMTILGLAFFRKSVLQVLTMLLFAVILQDILIYKRYIGPLVFEVSLLFIILNYIINFFTLKPQVTIPSNIKLLIVIFLTCAMLSSITAIMSGVNIGNEMISFQVYILWAVMFLMYGVQIRQLPSYSQVQIERIFAIICICVAMIHIFSIFTDSSIETIRADASLGKRDAASQFRYGGVFGNPNIQSAFLVGGLSYCMFLYIRRTTIIDKMLSGLGFVLSLSSVAMSGSRMALLSSALLILLFIIYNRKQIGRLLHFILGVTVIIGVIGFLKSGAFINHINKTFRRIEGKEGEEDIRLTIWDCTKDMIPDNPLGMGIFNEKFMNDIYDCIGSDLGNPHNMFLDFAVHLGVPGMIVFIVCTFLLIRIIIKKLITMKYNESDSNYFFLFAMLIFGFSEAFIFSLHKLHLVVFFVIGVTFGARKKIVGFERKASLNNFGSNSNNEFSPEFLKNSHR